MIEAVDKDEISQEVCGKSEGKKSELLTLGNISVYVEK